MQAGTDSTAPFPDSGPSIRFRSLYPAFLYAGHPDAQEIVDTFQMLDTGDESVRLQSAPVSRPASSTFPSRLLA